MYLGGKGLSNDHEALVADVQKLEVFLMQDGDIVVAVMQVAWVFSEFETILSFGDNHDIVGFLKLEALLKGQVVPDLLESLFVALFVGDGLVDLQAEE